VRVSSRTVTWCLLIAAHNTSVLTETGSKVGSGGVKGSKVGSGGVPQRLVESVGGVFDPMVRPAIAVLAMVMLRV